MSDVKDIFKMLEQAAYLTETNSRQLGMINTQLARHEEEIRRTGDKLEKLTSDFTDWKTQQKEREYIEPEDVQQLHELVTNRVADLLKKYDIDFKYFGRFMSQAWRDGKKHSYVVGKTGVYTRRMYLNDVKEYYGQWTPYGYGVIGYKEHLDLLESK